MARLSAPFSYLLVLLLATPLVVQAAPQDDWSALQRRSGRALNRVSVFQSRIFRCTSNFDFASKGCSQ